MFKAPSWAPRRPASIDAVQGSDARGRGAEMELLPPYRWESNSRHPVAVPNCLPTVEVL